MQLEKAPRKCKMNEKLDTHSTQLIISVQSSELANVPHKKEHLAKLNFPKVEISCLKIMVFTPCGESVHYVEKSGLCLFGLQWMQLFIFKFSNYWVSAYHPTKLGKYHQCHREVWKCGPSFNTYGRELDLVFSPFLLPSLCGGSLSDRWLQGITTWWGA